MRGGEGQRQDRQSTYKFNNSDIVEIITRSSSQPSLDWLGFVKTSHARNRIKGFYRKQHYSESLTKGREILEREIEKLGHDAGAILKSDDILAVAKSLNMHSESDLFAAIGYGHLATATVINRLKIEGRAQAAVFPCRGSGKAQRR